MSELRSTIESLRPEILAKLPDARIGLELVRGRPVFRRPDGSLLEDRAPP